MAKQKKKLLCICQLKILVCCSSQIERKREDTTKNTLEGEKVRRKSLKEEETIEKRADFTDILKYEGAQVADPMLWLRSRYQILCFQLGQYRGKAIGMLPFFQSFHYTVVPLGALLSINADRLVPPRAVKILNSRGGPSQ